MVSPIGLRLALGVVSLFLCLPWHVRAQSSDRATEQFMNADFRGARDSFSALLDSSDIDATAAAIAHAHLAALAFMFDDESSAALHAEAALALDPDTLLPEGSPPRAIALMEDLRERLSGRTARIFLSREAAEDDSVIARLDPAPELIATELELECDGETGETGENTDDRWSVRGPLPEVRVLVGIGPVHCRAVARGSGGAPLITRNELLVPIEPVDPPPLAPEVAADPEPASPAQRRSNSRRGLWIGIGVGAAVIILVTAIVLGTTLPEDDANLNETVIEGW